MTAIDIGKSLLGLQEIKDKKKLMDLFKSVGIICNPATTSWCSAFMNYCQIAAGNKGTMSLMAKSWAKWGVKVEPDDAKEGDAVVFNRGSDPVFGHIAFFVEWDDDRNLVKVLGGNQSDKVCYSYYPQNRIFTIRRAK